MNRRRSTQQREEAGFVEIGRPNIESCVRIVADLGRAAFLGGCITAASCAGPTDVGNGAPGGNSGSGAGSPSSGNSSNPGGSTGNSSGSTVVGSSGVTLGGDASSGQEPSGSGGSGEGDSSATNTPSDANEGDDGPASSNDGAPPSDGGMMPSPGCGKPPGQALQTFVAKQTMAGTMNRTYRVWLPPGYDPKRPYRAVFLGHGCGGNAGQPFPGLEKVVDAVLVALVAVGSCFDNGNGTTNSPELVYFDQAAKEVSANFCIDQARVFVAGFSSGSWLSHLIGCARAGTGPGKVRGQITATGEWPNPPPCTGPIASMLAHDMADGANAFAAGMVARDHILKANNCGPTTVPYSYDGVTPATPTSGGCPVATKGCQPCVEYQGCTPGYPMIWCPTKGSNPSHNNQEPLTTVGLWKFIQQF